jgi:hypothetical protein
MNYKENLPYLQRVAVSHILESKPSDHIAAGRKKRLKIWSRVEAKETDGIIIGSRTLCNLLDDYFSAYLVSFNMRENPVYVLPEDLTINPVPRLPRIKAVLPDFKLGLSIDRDYLSDPILTNRGNLLPDPERLFVDPNKVIFEEVEPLDISKGKEAPPIISEISSQSNM